MNGTLTQPFALPPDGWYQIAAHGEFPHKSSGLLQIIDPDACRCMVDSFRADAQQPNFAGLLIDFDHFSLDQDKPSEAAGWIVGLDNRPSGLWAQIRWSDRGHEAVTGGRYRFISPVWQRDECEVLENQRVRPKRLCNAAVTNDPNIAGMAPLSNRNGAPMDDDQRRAMFARMHGGGGGPRTPTAPEDTTSPLDQAADSIGVNDSTRESIARVEEYQRRIDELNGMRQPAPEAPDYSQIDLRALERDLYARGGNTNDIRRQIEAAKQANDAKKMAMRKIEKDARVRYPHDPAKQDAYVKKLLEAQEKAYAKDLAAWQKREDAIAKAIAKLEGAKNEETIRAKEELNKSAQRTMTDEAEQAAKDQAAQERAVRAQVEADLKAAREKAAAEKKAKEQAAKEAATIAKPAEPVDPVKARRAEMSRRTFFWKAIELGELDTAQALYPGADVKTARRQYEEISPAKSASPRDKASAEKEKAVLRQEPPPGMRNRGYMSDEQRRAMFARMHGGGSSGRSSGWTISAKADKGRPQAPTDGGPEAMAASGGGGSSTVLGPLDDLVGGTIDLTAQSASETLGISEEVTATVLGLLGLLGGRVPRLRASLGSTAGTAVSTALASGGTAGLIGEYREANPTMDPRTEKALALCQQLSGYVAAIAGLTASKQLGGRALEGTSVKKGSQAALKAAGDWIEDVGTAIGGKLPKQVRDALAKAYRAYNTVSDYTGSTITDVVTPKNTTAANLKRAVVIAGFAGREVYEETKIASEKAKMEQAWAEGRDYTTDPVAPRSALGTVGATLAGTAGNALEKQFRYDTYAEQTADYRARYDAIGKAELSGELSAQQAEDERRKLAGNKPWNMAGKGLWTFAPASASFLSWKAQELGDKLDRTTLDEVRKVRDADTITSQQSPQGIRFLDINAPEIPHPEMGSARAHGEMYGEEAARRMAELLTPGQAFRLVRDSHPKAAAGDVHGRQLGYVETLPRPFDNLLRVPVLGEMIPAREVNEQLLREGYADVRYRELSGTTDRQVAHDKARRRAEAEGRNVWSDEGRAALPWVGQTPDARDSSTNLPLWRKAMLPAGLGLMTTGQSGAFKAMGPGGNAAAQAWNAALAVGGAAEYNAVAAERSKPRKYAPPKFLQTDYEKRAAEARGRRRISATSPGSH